MTPGQILSPFQFSPTSVIASTMGITHIKADGSMPSRGLNLSLFRRCLKRVIFSTCVHITVISSLTYTDIIPLLSYGFHLLKILYNSCQQSRAVSSAISVVSSIAVSYYNDLSGLRWEAVILAGASACSRTLILLFGEFFTDFKFFCIHFSQCGVWD